MATDAVNAGYNTPAWTAPELLMGNTPLTPYESDVFSLGVVLWEVLYVDVLATCPVV
jgi:serine/threonine protein kinase